MIDEWVDLKEGRVRKVDLRMGDSMHPVEDDDMISIDAGNVSRVGLDAVDDDSSSEV